MLVFWLAVCSEQVASSNFHLLVKAGCFRYCCNTLRTGKYASFYVQNPITDFTELLERVKKTVPVLKFIPDYQIRISYKDVQLGIFVNIDSHEQLHLQETFRNAFPCGSDSYRRVHLKVRESDSPFLLKSSRSSQPLPQETEHTKPSVAESKLEPKHFSHHLMIVMNQSWLALWTGRILRKNSCFSRTTREITFSLFETEVMLLSIAVNSQYSNMKNRLLRQQIEIWIATCSEQTANQNTNIAWQYCKVVRKRTTGFTEITQHLQGEYSCLLLVLITHNLWCYFSFFLVSIFLFMIILHKTNESQIFHFQSVPTHVWVTLIKERLSKEDCISKVCYILMYVHKQFWKKHN